MTSVPRPILRRNLPDYDAGESKEDSFIIQYFTNLTVFLPEGHADLSQSVGQVNGCAS